MKYHRSAIPYVNSIYRFDPILGCATRPVEYYADVKEPLTNNQLKKIRDEKRAIELELRS